MRLFKDKTSDYEEIILSKINEKEVLPEVISVKNNGVCYKRQGIPFIFEVQTLKKANKRFRVVKLFNIKIFKRIITNDKKNKRITSV